MNCIFRIILNLNITIFIEIKILAKQFLCKSFVWKKNCSQRPISNFGHIESYLKICTFFLIEKWWKKSFWKKFGLFEKGPYWNSIHQAEHWDQSPAVANDYPASSEVNPDNIKNRSKFLGGQICPALWNWVSENA